MDDHERQFFAWAGRSIAAAFVACLGWLLVWLWNRVHNMPAQLDALKERLREEYATKESLMKLEHSLRDALKESAEQRRELHAENGRKLDSISQDIRELTRTVNDEIRSVHKRLDDHVERHHSK